ncbi:patatin-like phospholipase family protein [bacterium]|nr:patatin-like phospholipase family protein [bacterium]
MSLPVSNTPRQKKLAIVLSGGGARGAYEAGVIHYIRTMLPPHIAKKRHVDILAGSSIGAINTCFMAATAHNLEFQGQQAYTIWNNLNQNNVYRRGVGSLTAFLMRSFFGIMRNIFSRGNKNLNQVQLNRIHFSGFLDTTPLPRLLHSIIPWRQIPVNIQNGHIKAVSLTTTNIHSGVIEHFIQKDNSIVYTGRHKAHYVNLDVRHTLASSAIPVLFPPVRIGNDYYCDGGLRLNTPMSPAIHMGAEKVLVIGLHHKSESAEAPQLPVVDLNPLYPSLGELMGNILKTVLVDRLEYDLAQLARINQIINACKEAFGSDFLEKLNGYMAEHGKGNEFGIRGLTQIEALGIFPSRDIRKVFFECVEQKNFLRQNTSYFERFLLKALDVDLMSGLDFLTFILFIPAYLKKLLELGFEDARANHNKLVSFFED